MFLAPLLFFAANAQSDLEAKVDHALAKMSQEEKLRLIGGYRGFDVQPIESLSMGPVAMSDGPVGVRGGNQSLPTTAYPAGVCLAATFDQALMYDMGDAIGKDARGRGIGFWLGPGVNLARIVQNGRNFEYFGEDPWLASRCAVNVIEGVQAHGVAATVKHYAANNHEDDRNQDSSEVDERVMRELYLKPFEAAVKEARVWSVMCSYNKINGTYASANKWLLTDVLKQDWRFPGVVMSDWGAAHDGIADFNAGLDLEMPGAAWMTPKRIGDALADGQVSQDLLDDKVRRILRVCYALDLVGPERAPTQPKDSPENATVARREAEEGIVLLRNNGILPLSKAGNSNVLVLGPNALRPLTGGGGSAYTVPLHSEPLLDAMKRVFARAHTVEGLNDALGNPFLFSGYDDLSATYFKGKTLAGEAVSTVKETRINHVWTVRRPSPAGALDFSARWTGHFTTKSTGDFVFTAESDDGIRVWIDGKPVIDHWDDHASSTDVANTHLDAGRHDLKVEYYQGTGEAIARFGIVELSKTKNYPELNAALDSSSAVVVGVGFNERSEGEGHDRPFDLPFEQRLLLDAVTAHSKRVILVVNSGAGVNLAPWLGKVAAIIEAWYPGQEGATALTEILSGDVNPSGKLPTSFPISLTGTYYADAYPPVNHRIDYKEGMLTGYRWFDKMNRDPMYPFGFGLSYSKFRLTDANARVDRDAIKAAVVVGNIGKRYAGDEIVQFYVGPAKAAAGEPLKQLKAFARVKLDPGHAAKVEATIPLRQLATWDTPGHQWVVTPGKYIVYIGTSSRDVTPISLEITEGDHFRP